jgi:hypothetical protein
MVFAFIAAPPALPVAVKPLLPMKAALSKNFPGEEEGEVRREEDDGGGVG